MTQIFLCSQSKIQSLNIFLMAQAYFLKNHWPCSKPQKRTHSSKACVCQCPHYDTHSFESIVGIKMLRYIQERFAPKTPRFGVCFKWLIFYFSHPSNLQIIDTTKLNEFHAHWMVLVSLHLEMKLVSE